MSVRVLIIIESVPPVLVLILQVDQVLVDFIEGFLTDLLLRQIESSACICVDMLILRQFLSE